MSRRPAYLPADYVARPPLRCDCPVQHDLTLDADTVAEAERLLAAADPVAAVAAALWERNVEIARLKGGRK